jgi:hypothetical protein
MTHLKQKPWNEKEEEIVVTASLVAATTSSALSSSESISLNVKLKKGKAVALRQH